MSVKSQRQNMETIHSLVSHDLSYIHGERESGPTGTKKALRAKAKAFLRTLGNDLGLAEFKVTNNYGGIAVSGEITLMGMWGDGDGLYFQISQPLLPLDGFLYCSIAHMKDYSGGRNQYLPCSLFTAGEYERLLEILLSLRKSPEVARRAA